MSAADHDTLTALTEFLAESFTSNEISRFVRKLPDGSRLGQELPEPPASRAQVADGLICALQRRGMLDREFFGALASELPRRSAVINALMLRYLPGPLPTLHLQAEVLLCGGRFQLEEIIGAGGFATLWRARDTLGGPPVAIKVLSRNIPDSEYAWHRAMFIRGATRMTKIAHPCIAKVLNPHCNEQGHDFCVLEFVPGRSLHAEVKSGRIDSVAEIIRILLDVGVGLAQIHANGAVHGDVSPKNILVQRTDGARRARIVDFDLVYTADDELLTLAATGMPGTDPYAAPEWKARRPGLDGRVDVFSLGMTAVYALSGRPLPPSLNDPDVLDPLEYIERKLECSPEIRAVLQRACAFNRADRYPEMINFCAALKALLEDAGGSTTLTGTFSSASLATLSTTRAHPKDAFLRGRMSSSRISRLLSAAGLIGAIIAPYGPEHGLRRGTDHLPVTTGEVTKSSVKGADTLPARTGELTESTADGADTLPVKTGEFTASSEDCTPALQDVPAPFFNEGVLIRLPVNVTLTQTNPFTARSMARTSICGQPIEFVGVGYFWADQKQSLEQMRDAMLLSRFGPGAPIQFSAKESKPGMLGAAYELPPDPSTNTVKKGWIRLQEKGDVVLWVALETTETSWPALQQLFRASSSRVVLIRAQLPSPSDAMPDL